eukprot:4504112-Amphidinium_carterae.1
MAHSKHCRRPRHEMSCCVGSDAAIAVGIEHTAGENILEVATRSQEMNCWWWQHRPIRLTHVNQTRGVYTAIDRCLCNIAGV